jgi:hypothetical protein
LVPDCRQAQLQLCYRSLKASLSALLSRPGFEKKCELWRERYNPATHRRWPITQALFDPASHTRRARGDLVRSNKDLEQLFGELSVRDMDKAVKKEEKNRIYTDIWDGRMWEDAQFVTKEGKLWGPERRQRQPEQAKEQVAHGSSKRARHSPPDSASDSSASFLPPSLFGARPLLAAPGTLALALNVDWFQPFNKSVYSMGAVYMTVLNLPREERYRPENMILVALLPGPKETSRTQLQGALRPLRDELLDLFDPRSRFQARTADSPDGRPLQAFLLNVVCDTPAARSLCGFPHISATCGCPYCHRSFSGRGDKDSHRDWRLSSTQHPTAATRQTDALHRHYAKQWSELKTFADQALHVKQHGSRYCTLMDLPYFDSVRGVVVDVMHNFFLGTVKHVMKKLLCEEIGQKQRKGETDTDISSAPAAPTASAAPAASAASAASASRASAPRASASRASASAASAASAAGASATEATATSSSRPVHPAILHSTNDLGKLQEFVDACRLPGDIGRLPRKIASNMSNFKAQEWSNWICIFAVPALRQLMVSNDKDAPGHPRFKPGHLLLIQDMQQAGELLRSYVLTIKEIQTIHDLLCSVIERCELLFSAGGASVISPNMHLSLHLREMLLDYGPPAGWWCYPYERFNGLLTNQPRNPTYPAIGVMKRAMLLQGIAHTVYMRMHAERAGREQSTQAAESPSSPGEPGYEDFSFLAHILMGSGLEVDCFSSPGPSSSSSSSSLLEVHHRTHVSRTGVVQHQYVWGSGQSRLAQFEHFFRMRHQPSHTETNGHEPFPGQLQGTSKIVHLEVPLENKQNRSPLGEHVHYAGVVDALRKHLYDCLQRHYIFSYSENFLEDPDMGFTEEQKKKVRAAVKDGGLAAASNAIQLFRLPIMYRHLWMFPTANIFNSLVLGGERYGSRRGGLRSHCYALIKYLNVDNKGVDIWFGEIQFFVEHVLEVYNKDTTKRESVTHTFAMMTFHHRTQTTGGKTTIPPTPPLPERPKETEKPTKEGAQTSEPKKTSGKRVREPKDDGPVEANVNKQKWSTEWERVYQQFPRLEKAYAATHVQDLVPVQRIVGRWTPCMRESTMLACPLPSRLHA